MVGDGLEDDGGVFDGVGYGVDGVLVGGNGDDEVVGGEVDGGFDVD